MVIGKVVGVHINDQNLKNGFGVFLDDLIAGFLSFLVFFCFYLLLT